MQQNIWNTGMASPLEKLYDCMVTGTLGIMSATTERSLNQIGLTDNEKEILKIKYYLKTKRGFFLKWLWLKQRILI